MVAFFLCGVFCVKPVTGTDSDLRDFAPPCMPLFGVRTERPNTAVPYVAPSNAFPVSVAPACRSAVPTSMPDATVVRV